MQLLFLNVNYIVSGGAGYLGAHLVYSLLEEGHKITIFDDLSRAPRQPMPSPVEFVNLDISDGSAMERIRFTKRIDGFFHLAAKKSVNESMLNPALYEQVNVVGTQNILNLCLRNEIEAVVLTSSAAVYGSLEKKEEILETDPTVPISPYGLSKLNAERMLTKYVEEGSIKGAILRCFNLAGARESNLLDLHGENVIPILVKAINDEQTFKIFGNSLATPDGTCVRDYIHVEDVSMAHTKAMEKLQSAPSGYIDTFNIASKSGTSTLSLVKAFESLIGRRVQYQFDLPRKGDVEFSIGDNSKANKILNWTPKHGLDRIVKDSWEANLSSQ